MADTPGGSVASLISSGLVTPQQASDARDNAQKNGTTVIEELVRAGIVDRSVLLRLAAETAGLEYTDLNERGVDAGAASLLGSDFAKKNGVIPFGFSDEGELLVAAPMRKIHDLDLKDDLSRLTKRTIKFVLAARPDIDDKIDKVYRATDELMDLSSELVVSDDVAEDLSTLTEVADDAPVVRFVDLIITQGITDRASDIHLEPTERDLRVRYRIDGVLQDAHAAPRSIANGVISRIKIMSGLNIAERRIPQDGRLSVAHKNGKMDLRIATLPTVWGEKIVGRILDNSNTKLSLDDLGFSPNNLATFRESYKKPYGMILVTGPTGSGKSTSLYATLNILNKPEVNIITVEDPVEYRLPGINQVQVNPKAGLTFASALRSILRSDPDIVLLGEIRDHETANIATEAALTGHLVLSTLHTNDAPSAVTRLVEMGIEPFLVGSAVDCILAQRLCRALCPKCKIAVAPDFEEIEQLGFVWPEMDAPEVLYVPGGCQACAKTGYRGRMALHEVMAMTEDIERLTVKRASTEEISTVAKEQGMTVLRQDGWLKVLSGKTSIEEVLRVVG